MKQPAHGMAGMQAIQKESAAFSIFSWREGGEINETDECFGKAACFDKHEA